MHCHTQGCLPSRQAVAGAACAAHTTPATVHPAAGNRQLDAPCRLAPCTKSSRDTMWARKTAEGSPPTPHHQHQVEVPPPQPLALHHVPVYLHGQRTMQPSPARYFRLLQSGGIEPTAKQPPAPRGRADLVPPVVPTDGTNTSMAAAQHPRAQRFTSCMRQHAATACDDDYCQHSGAACMLTVGRGHACRCSCQH